MKPASSQGFMMFKNYRLKDLMLAVSETVMLPAG